MAQGPGRGFRRQVRKGIETRPTGRGKGGLAQSDKSGNVVFLTWRRRRHHYDGAGSIPGRGQQITRRHTDVERSIFP